MKESRSFRRCPLATFIAGSTRQYWLPACTPHCQEIPSRTASSTGVTGLLGQIVLRDCMERSMHEAQALLQSRRFWP
jgi:hypothetical protein